MTELSDSFLASRSQTKVGIPLVVVHDLRPFGSAFSNVAPVTFRDRIEASGTRASRIVS